jgi:hypothetical protein
MGLNILAVCSPIILLIIQRAIALRHIQILASAKQLMEMLLVIVATTVVPQHVPIISARAKPLIRQCQDIVLMERVLIMMLANAKHLMPANQDFVLDHAVAAMLVQVAAVQLKPGFATTLCALIVM